MFSSKIYSQAMANYSKELGCASEVFNIKLTDAGTTAGVCIEIKRAN